MYHHRLLLLLSLAALLITPVLIDLWLFGGQHWWTPFLIWLLLAAATAVYAWSRGQRHDP